MNGVDYAVCIVSPFFRFVSVSSAGIPPPVAVIWFHRIGTVRTCGCVTLSVEGAFLLRPSGFLCAIQRFVSCLRKDVKWKSQDGCVSQLAHLVLYSSHWKAPGSLDEINTGLLPHACALLQREDSKLSGCAADFLEALLEKSSSCSSCPERVPVALSNSILFFSSLFSMDCWVHNKKLSSKFDESPKFLVVCFSGLVQNLMSLLAQLHPTAKTRQQLCRLVVAACCAWQRFFVAVGPVGSLWHLWVSLLEAMMACAKWGHQLAAMALPTWLQLSLGKICWTSTWQ